MNFQIQNASTRPERVFIDSQQLRKCATYFELAVLLLRVLEMIVTIAPHHFLDFTRINSELWLSRLCQIISQLLNRVNSLNKCFSYVVNLEIPGLETIHHYPIITAIVGIVVALLKSNDSKNKFNPISTRVLLKEPSFQLSFLSDIILDVNKEKSKSKVPNNSGESSSSSSIESLISAAEFPIQESNSDIGPWNASSLDLTAVPFSLKDCEYFFYFIYFLFFSL